MNKRVIKFAIVAALASLALCLTSSAGAQTLNAAAPLEVTNTSTQAFSTGLPAPPSIVFKPGGVRGGNVYTTWSQVDQVAKTMQGHWTLFFDASASGGVVTIPAGSWTLAPEAEWRCSDDLTDAGAGVIVDNAMAVVDIANNVTINWPPSIVRDCAIVSEGSVSADGGSYAVFTQPAITLSLLGAAQLVGGNLPMFALGGNEEAAAGSCAGSQMFLHDTSLIIPDNFSVSVFTDGVSACGANDVYAYDNSSVGEDSFDATISNGYIFYDYGASVSQTQTSATFTFTPNFAFTQITGVAVIVPTSTPAAKNAFTTLAAACEYLNNVNQANPSSNTREGAGDIIFSVQSYTLTAADFTFCFHPASLAPPVYAPVPVVWRGLASNGSISLTPQVDAGVGTPVQVTIPWGLYSGATLPQIGLIALDNIQLTLGAYYDGGANDGPMRWAPPLCGDGGSCGSTSMTGYLRLLNGASIVQAPNAHGEMEIDRGTLNVVLNDTSAIVNQSDGGLIIGDGGLTITALGTSSLGPNVGTPTMGTTLASGSPAATFDTSYGSVTLDSLAANVSYTGGACGSSTTVQTALNTVCAATIDAGVVVWGGGLAGSTNSSQNVASLNGASGGGGATTITSSALQWASSLTPQYTQATPTTDVATHTTLIQSQAPYSGASTNKATGSIALDTPAPDTGLGNQHGYVMFEDSEVEYVSISEPFGMQFTSNAANPDITQNALNDGGVANAMEIVAQGSYYDGGQGAELLLSAGAARTSGGAAVLQGGAGSGEAIVQGGGGVLAGVPGGSAAISTGTPGIGGSNGQLYFQIAGSQGFEFENASSTVAGFLFDPSYTGGVTIGINGAVSSTNGVPLYFESGTSTHTGSQGGQLVLGTGGGPGGPGDIDFDVNGTLACRVDGVNDIIKISAPLIGDSNAPDALRFGVYSSVSLAGVSSNVTLSASEYANQTVWFTGTPDTTSVDTIDIILPNVGGYEKLLDFSAVTFNTMRAGSTVSLEAGSSTCPLPTDGAGPQVIASYDGTTLKCGFVGAYQGGYQSYNSSTVNFSTGGQSLLGGSYSVTVNVNEILDVSASVNYECTVAGSAPSKVAIYVDGSAAAGSDSIATASVSTPMFGEWSKSYRTAPLSAGAHTVDIQGFDGTGATCTGTNAIVRVNRVRY